MLKKLLKVIRADQGPEFKELKKYIIDMITAPTEDQRYVSKLKQSKKK